jgi:hypothetical protein
MNNQSHKNILILLSVLMLVGFGILGLEVYSIIQTNKSVADLSHTISVEAHQQQTQSLATTLVNNADPDISLVNNSVLTSDGDVSFIEYLESVAKSYNLQVVIDSLSLADDSTLAPDNMDLLQVKVDVKGSWTDVYLFTSRIEALPYSVRIDGVDILNTKNIGSLDPAVVTPASGAWQETVNMSVLKRIQ